MKTGMKRWIALTALAALLLLPGCRVDWDNDRWDVDAPAAIVLAASARLCATVAAQEEDEVQREIGLFNCAVLFAAVIEAADSADE